eukprot:Clim_evm8s242 gene=Clim_evmTU8s242
MCGIFLWGRCCPRGKDCALKADFENSDLWKRYAEKYSKELDWDPFSGLSAGISPTFLREMLQRRGPDYNGKVCKTVQGGGVLFAEATVLALRGPLAEAKEGQALPTPPSTEQIEEKDAVKDLTKPLNNMQITSEPLVEENEDEEWNERIPEDADDDQTPRSVGPAVSFENIDIDINIPKQMEDDIKPTGDVMYQPRALDDKGSFFMWNGEIYDGVLLPEDDESDTDAIARAMRAIAQRPDAVEAALSRVIAGIRGPFAFVFYHAGKGRLYYGRDVLGRRSLLLAVRRPYEEALDAAAREFQDSGLAYEIMQQHQQSHEEQIRTQDKYDSHSSLELPDPASVYVKQQQRVREQHEKEIQQFNEAIGRKGPLPQPGAPLQHSTSMLDTRQLAMQARLNAIMDANQSHRELGSAYQYMPHHQYQHALSMHRTLSTGNAAGSESMENINTITLRRDTTAPADVGATATHEQSHYMFDALEEARRASLKKDVEEVLGLTQDEPDDQDRKSNHGGDSQPNSRHGMGSPTLTSAKSPASPPGLKKAAELPRSKRAMFSIGNDLLDEVEDLDDVDEAKPADEDSMATIGLSEEPGTTHGHGLEGLDALRLGLPRQNSIGRLRRGMQSPVPPRSVASLSSAGQVIEEMEKDEWLAWRLRGGGNLNHFHAKGAGSIISASGAGGGGGGGGMYMDEEQVLLSEAERAFRQVVEEHLNFGYGLPPEEICLASVCPPQVAPFTEGSTQENSGADLAQVEEEQLVRANTAPDMFGSALGREDSTSGPSQAPALVAPWWANELEDMAGQEGGKDFAHDAAVASPPPFGSDGHSPIHATSKTDVMEENDEFARSVAKIDDVVHDIPVGESGCAVQADPEETGNAPDIVKDSQTAGEAGASFQHNNSPAAPETLWKEVPADGIYWIDLTKAGMPEGRIPWGSSRLPTPAPVSAAGALKALAHAQSSLEAPTSTDSAAISLLRALSTAVKRRVRSLSSVWQRDFGVLYSGGLDSTLLTALAIEVLATPKSRASPLPPPPVDEIFKNALWQAPEKKRYRISGLNNDQGLKVRTDDEFIPDRDENESFSRNVGVEECSLAVAESPFNNPSGPHVNPPILHLLNVAFGSKAKGIDPWNAPDRRTALISFAELAVYAAESDMNNHRLVLWLIDIDEDEVKQGEAHVRRLIRPKTTFMDLSIGTALWFASRGIGAPYVADVAVAREIHDRLLMKAAREQQAERLKELEEKKRRRQQREEERQRRRAGGAAPADAAVTAAPPDLATETPEAKKQRLSREKEQRKAEEKARKAAERKKREEERAEEQEMDALLLRVLIPASAEGNELPSTRKSRSQGTTTQVEKSSGAGKADPTKPAKLTSFAYTHEDPQQRCPARVLLSGLGADECHGGYSRHRSAWQQGGEYALAEELRYDLSRIADRNLGRDDRVVSDHGREVRYPFLDEEVLTVTATIGVGLRCNFDQPRGHGEKRLLRRLARDYGMLQCAIEPKRAIQFGTRFNKLQPQGVTGTTELGSL